MKNPHEGWPTMMFCEPLTGASRWFAWHPIRTWDYRWRWLCWVERRLIHGKPHLDHRGLNTPVWQHRIIRTAAPDDSKARASARATPNHPNPPMETQTA